MTETNYAFVDETSSVPIAKATYVPITSKSRAGIEYVKYHEVKPPMPTGHNRQARRRLERGV